MVSYGFAGEQEVVNKYRMKAHEYRPSGWNTFIVIATRGHKLDAHCLRAAVKTSARYVGLLGSKRKTILIAKMLRDEGVDEVRIRAGGAPIGLDPCGGKHAQSVDQGTGSHDYDATGDNGPLP